MRTADKGACIYAVDACVHMGFPNWIPADFRGRGLALYPNGVSANSGHFVCGLCAQNVLLTAPGANTRHFRHDSASPNKECDERQASFDPTYGRQRLQFFNSHAMPLRIAVCGNEFVLRLGFFWPPDARAHCDKIKIVGDSSEPHEYLFERIEHAGTTYLDAGSIPSKRYQLDYIKGLYHYMLPLFSECFIRAVPSLDLWPGKRAEDFEEYTSTKRSPLRLAGFKRLGLSRLLLNRLESVLSDAKAMFDTPAEEKDMEILLGLLPLSVLTGRRNVLRETVESDISRAVKEEAARYFEEA